MAQAVNEVSVWEVHSADHEVDTSEVVSQQPHDGRDSEAGTGLRGEGQPALQIAECQDCY